ncbi:MAG: hypothetical protein KH319_08495 [Butyricicoccus pullicaecorum]|nr:hypothetical protein [Butyricicoccus pullicaecorum]
MPRKLRLCALALCIALCVALMPGAGASTIVLTAVNDDFLPLTSSTMPTRRSGEWYVPYSVFRSFSLTAAEQEDGDLLVIQGENNTLTFSVSQGYVYDQNMNSYSQPAYPINGTIYVPVKLVCGVYGLSFSLISGEHQVLRICDENAMLSDSSFVTQSEQEKEDIVEEYIGPPEPPRPVEPEPDPSEPEPVPPEQPIEPAAIRPELIYLTFAGAPNEYSEDLLNTLSMYNRHATFFLPVEGEWDADLVRAIVGEGHSVGFMVPVDRFDETGILTAANERLFEMTGTVTRLISVEGGSGKLTEKQRAAAASGGYRLWDATIVADDQTQSASRVADLMLRSFDGTTATTVLGMHHTRSTNAALTLILRDLRVNHVSTAAITAADTPVHL